MQVLGVAVPALYGQSYTITTFAGGGLPNNVSGTAVSLVSMPQGLAADSSGNLFFLYQNSVLRLDAGSGMLTVAAGNGTPGYSGDTGPATNAQLNSPTAVAVDTAGNLYIADCLNSRVRKVSNGVITTVAGSGTYGFGGDNGPATAAMLSCPSGVAVDQGGNLYIADRANYIRKVTNGTITTVAGNGLEGYTGDNGPASQAQVNFPSGLATDTSGNLFIADSGNHAIREISGGTIQTVAGTGAPGYNGDNILASSAQLNSPSAVTVSPGNDLYIADTMNNRIRKVSHGQITTIAGNGSTAFFEYGPATFDGLNAPNGVALDPAGNVCLTDSADFRVRKIVNGQIGPVAGSGSFSGDGGLATSAWLSSPAGVGLDSSGNLYIADASNRVREVAAGVINTVAGTGTPGFQGNNQPALDAQLNNPQEVAVDAQGNLYIGDVNGVHQVANGIIDTFVANSPQGLAVDAAGNVYLSRNNVVQKVSPDGGTTTVAGTGAAGYSGDNGPANAARLNNPMGLAVDSSNNLYIADSGNNRIRMVSNGTITTIAGTGLPGSTGDTSLAINARLSAPSGLAVDTAGNLYIVDAGARVRKVSSGLITTIAGGGTQFRDNVPGTASSLTNAFGIAVDKGGNVYVADCGVNRVRILQPQAANLSILSTHGDFYQQEIGATYTLTVSNAAGAGATVGLVTVTESLPGDLTLVSMTGSGWNCSVNTCTRSDALAGGASYPPITVTVNVSKTALTPQVNSVTLIGGGILVTISDPTIVDQCQFTLTPSSVNLLATGTSTAMTCPDPTQPTCGFTPDTPSSITLTATQACGAWTASSSNAPYLQLTSGVAGIGNGTINYTALTNIHSAQRNETITVTNGVYSATFTATQAGSSDSLLYRQVYALYEQLLWRDPDLGGFNFWTSQNVTLGTMADQFLTSAEVLGSDFSVMAAYQAAQGAPPTYAQFLLGVTALRSGMTLTALFNSLIGGNYSATNLYQNLLGRAPTSSEITSANGAGLAAWFQTLTGYPGLAANNEFQSTGTFHTDHTNALYIQMLYYLILGRNPDAGGLSFWTGVANSGGPGLLFQGSAGAATRIEILGTGAASEGFLGGPEFQGMFAN